MRSRVFFSLVGAVIAAVALVSASGAATTKAEKVTRIDVSTRAAVIHYLRSIHVNATGAVIQRGARNYAGAHCPGTRWTCVGTRHTVVQIARRGGQNRFVCRRSRCAVVQFAGVSHGVYITGRRLASTASPTKGSTATCIKTTGLGASCTISQLNGSSSTASPTAIIVEGQVAPGQKATGLTQAASYTAQISQSTGSGNNLACVLQQTNIDGSTNLNGKKGTAITVTLEAHQSIIVRQDSMTGSNTAENATYNRSTGVAACDSSPLSQGQTLSSTVTGTSSITQNENDQFSACGDGQPGDYANMCLDIEQNRSPGFKCITDNDCPATSANTAAFTQTSSQSAIANTPAGFVTQTQSSVCANNPNAPSDCVVPGGLVGTVNQDSSGVSTATATQIETQCEDAATSGLTVCHMAPGDADFNGSYQLTQNQYGPVGVGKLRNHHRGRQLYGHLKGLGTAKQTGNQGCSPSCDSFTISQTSTQDNDQGSGGSTSNQMNFGQADCSTSGNCTATQTTTVDGMPSSNFQSGQNVNASTNCSDSTCMTSGGQTGGQLAVSNTDVAEFGFGGMRGSGTGSIDVTGLSGAVTKALLYWNGPTNSTDPTANASVTFDNAPVTGTNIGFASPNCWNLQNSQSYRADVTGLVSGNGTYSLADFRKSADVEINGVALVVFYTDDNASNDRNVVLWNGNDSNFSSPYDPEGWDATLTGVPYPGSGSATLDFVVSDGQTADDGAISVNGTEIVPQGGIFQGDSTPAGTFNSSGDLWDVKPYSLPSNLLTTGSNTLEVTAPLASDCLSLVAVAANMPASAPVIP